MLSLAWVLIVSTTGCFGTAEPEGTHGAAVSSLQSDLYSISETLLDGSSYPLSQLRGQVVLVANFALRCGTTPQLKALEETHRQFEALGLVVIGVPSNDFTGEAMDDHAEIQHSCSKRFGVTFPLLSPGRVVGTQKRELYQHLTQQAPSEMRGEVGFNFEKFLVDRQGRVRMRFGPFSNPASKHVRAAIQELLDEKAPGS